jgi:hypothetical protein
MYLHCLFGATHNIICIRWRHAHSAPSSCFYKPSMIEARGEPVFHSVVHHVSIRLNERCIHTIRDGEIFEVLLCCEYKLPNSAARRIRHHLKIPTSFQLAHGNQLLSIIHAHNIPQATNKRRKLRAAVTHFPYALYYAPST